MDNSALIMLIGAGSSGLVAITALLLNYRGFAAIDNRFVSVERRLEMMQSDMRDLNKTMTVLETDVALLKNRAGLR